MNASAAANASPFGHSVLGNTGDLGAEELLEWLRNLKFTGTLALTGANATLLLLLARGQAEGSFRLGEYGSLSAAGQRFHLYPHEATDLPRLPARGPASASPVLRALPRLAPPARLAPGATRLAPLLERLAAGEHCGTLSYFAQESAAVALLLAGAVRAAVHETPGRVRSHAEALRALQKSEQAGAGGALELEEIDAAIMVGATALALEQTVEEGEAFSGLEVTPAGYRYWRAGQPFLLVPGETRGPVRRYALPAAPERAVEVELPTEPPGWEEQRYALTLRGADALDPMMELAMEFSTEHGESGQRLLSTLGSGVTLADAAGALGMELGKLKPWLERFEREGLLRRKVK